jgi:hypothetical protein
MCTLVLKKPRVSFARLERLIPEPIRDKEDANERCLKGIAKAAIPNKRTVLRLLLMLSELEEQQQSAGEPWPDHCCSQSRKVLK